MSTPESPVEGNLHVFRMPSLGADMETGTLTEWQVSVGDRVERGDIVAVVETEKADIEVEIFETGLVERLLVDEGEEVPVGTPLAHLRCSGSSAPELEAEQPGPEHPATPPPDHLGTPVIEARAERVARRRSASPAARALAAAEGLDLDTIETTGSGGSLVLADVEKAIAMKSRRVAATPQKTRQALAAAMARANAEIPHYYLSLDLDLNDALDWLRQENESRPMTKRLLPAALLLHAVALAAREIPEMNGYWIDDGFQHSERVHLGVAISRRGGEVVAPALLDAGQMTLEQTMAGLRDLVRRARAGSLRSSEVREATITVTNLGDLGATSVLGIIYPPQVALVGFGRISERPSVVEGHLEVRPMVTATLAADHRASDGYRGSRFLARIGELVAAPTSLAVH